MRLALYQPDIPQNAGALIRLGACLGVGVEIIEPMGFILDDRRLRRAHMDYLAHAQIARHASWERFLASRPPGRLVLLTAAGEQRYTEYRFRSEDILILGRESAGSSGELYAAAQASVRIPMVRGLRSLNVVTAAAVVLTEAMRQTGTWEKF